MSTKNLNHKEAKEKLINLVNDIKAGFLATGLTKKPVSAIPMSTKKVDDEGNLWFLSSMNSDHNADITKDSDVQMLYSDNSDMEFISIFGTASIVTDDNILKDFYSKIDDAWFSGPDDPSLSAIKIVPKEAYYWDTKQNKYITLFKMGLAALGGDQEDIGEKGKLNI
ncbi:pyridoxamine 5'-phosphate oxidase family protein [Salegentibacter sp. F188]|uniref:Pyridoxamine 5'-phosphate oxidase family protein n=1 Tax=Autumnicola patrickiae TaxID=3075591 RepID=A0ABU3DZM8_9FLAO|nr:pyridoxamine 5'-phosphate oxidase family protein [Salegentibacter sp. F188]MDT0689199.1 pyridoxamine 5'-phosphate oxidase family protein [Salegentibacter sp. F188]